MQSFIWKALVGVAFTGGLMALGAGVAYADNTTSGDDGTGSGSQAVVGLNAPITLGGNAISVLGGSSSSGSSTTPPASGSAPDGNTNGNVSLLGGTQTLADAHAPITVSGNAISLIGDSGSASSTVGSGSSGDGSSADGSGSSGTGSGTTSGDQSTLGGTQVLGDAGAPVTVTGNAISVAGDSSSDGSFAGQSASGSGSTDPDASGSNATTDGDNGTLGGTQVAPDAAVPVTATGDAISVIGDSSSSGASTGGGIAGVDTGTPGVTTSGDDGILGGSQLAPAVTAPVTVGGDAVSVIGDSSTTSGSGDTGGSGGDVGGVDTFPPATGTSVADLSVDALAETGVPALSALALGILLLMTGIAVTLRKVALRH